MLTTQKQALQMIKNLPERSRGTKTVLPTDSLKIICRRKLKSKKSRMPSAAPPTGVRRGRRTAADGVRAARNRRRETEAAAMRFTAEALRPARG